MRSRKKRFYYILICIAISAILLYISLIIKESNTFFGEPLYILIKEKNKIDDFEQMYKNDLKTKELIYTLQVLDEGTMLTYYGNGGYRYGPSIIRNNDGSLDVWLSSPGNNSTEWDWISYLHSDDGINWSSEKIILKPSYGTSDRCSVCDPGLIYFNGYYYLGYTSTSDSSRKGYNNSAFVARSKNPAGPYEKWNGSSWGGEPMPIISYDGDPDGWGIGELSFVILNDELYIYYTYFDLSGGNTSLAKAELVDDWPLTMKEYGAVLQRNHQDSLDVVYVDELETFLAFSIDYRMSESSRLIMYKSKDGTDFQLADTSKSNVEDYAHNMGISKRPDGHISIDDELLIGYGYGKGWGRWSSKLHNLKIHYKIVQ